MKKYQSPFPIISLISQHEPGTHFWGLYYCSWHFDMSIRWEWLKWLETKSYPTKCIQFITPTTCYTLVIYGALWCVWHSSSSSNLQLFQFPSNLKWLKQRNNGNKLLWYRVQLPQAMTRLYTIAISKSVGHKPPLQDDVLFVSPTNVGRCLPNCGQCVGLDHWCGAIHRANVYCICRQ